MRWHGETREGQAMQNGSYVYFTYHLLKGVK